MCLCDLHECIRDNSCKSELVTWTRTTEYIELTKLIDDLEDLKLTCVKQVSAHVQLNLCVTSNVVEYCACDIYIYIYIYIYIFMLFHSSRILSQH